MTASSAAPSPAVLRDAYAACEQITRTQARNFYYGIRLLAPQRRAMLCAVYAVARQVDDIGDGAGSAGAKSEALAGVREGIERVRRGDPPPDDPPLLALADAAARVPIPLDAFDELLDGVQMDVSGRCYETFDELVEYCRCVAGAIGRLCLAVFGSRPDPRAAGYADALGIALQQTNILRDIREDLLGGRVYLPQRDLDAHGASLRIDEQGRLSDPDGAVAAVIRASCRRARQWYADGSRLIPLLDRRSAACTAAMSGIYAHLLGVIERDPSVVYGRRISLSGPQKAAVALRALRGADPTTGGAR